MHPEPLEIVVRSGEPGDFELAAVAGAGVDVPDRERAGEQPRDLRVEPLADPLELAGGDDRLGDDARAERGPKLAKHVSAAPAGALPDGARAAWSGCRPAGC